MYKTKLCCEIPGSHGGEHEDDCLLGCRPDDGDSKHIRNVGKLLPDYAAQRRGRRPSLLLYALFDAVLKLGP
jgi:hypothetical protein